MFSLSEPDRNSIAAFKASSSRGSQQSLDNPAVTPVTC